MKQWFFVSLLLIAVFLVGCGKTATVQKIGAEEAKQRLDSEKGIVLVDVRTQEEHDAKYIPGSILLPLDSLETLAPQNLPDKKTTIFVYCRSGNRSAQAAALLSKMGYTDIVDIGGIQDWPYDVVGTEVN